MSGALAGFSATFATDAPLEDVVSGTENPYGGFVYGDGGCSAERGLDGLVRVTAPLSPYPSAIVNLSRVLGWISSNASTDNRCSLTVDIGFSPGMEPLYRLNVCKFVLGFDEDRFYKAFPRAVSRIGSRSVKTARPLSLDGAEPSVLARYNNYPSEDTSSLGVRFGSLKDGRLSFAYARGEGYASKQAEIVSLMEYFVLYTYGVLSSPEFTLEDINDMGRLNDAMKDYVARFSTYKDFKRHYKDVSLTVDLREMDGREEVYWNMLREGIYRLVTSFLEFSEGEVELNYDTDESVFQIRGARISGSASLENADAVESELSGIYSSCTLFSCKVSGSSLNYCRAVGESVVKDSLLSNSYISADTVCENCVITGDSTICGKAVSCKIQDGVKYTEDAVFRKCGKENLLAIRH